MRPAPIVVSSWVALTALLVGPPAQATGDPALGGALAQRWCAECHVTRANAAGPVPQGPPTFADMARKRTPDALRSFLTKPHEPMPALELSRADIDNLIAYIEAQR
jgi:mono/diheme cytochrome c family protein